jgi:hypothetical protein
MVPAWSQALYQNTCYDLLAIIGKRHRNGLRILECGFLQASYRSATAATWSARALIARTADEGFTLLGQNGAGRATLFH